MQVDSQNLRKNFQRMETEEILSIIQKRTLTENAHKIALDELKERLVDTSSLPQLPISDVEQYDIEEEINDSETFKIKFRNLIDGNYGLSKIFFLYLFIPLFVINFCFRYFEEYPIAAFIWSIIYIFYTIPVIIGLWRSANKRKGKSAFMIFIFTSIFCFLFSLSYIKVALIGLGALIIILEIG